MNYFIKKTVNELDTPIDREFDPPAGQIKDYEIGI